MGSTKVVGRDVTVYTLSVIDGNANVGGVTGMLGRWESVEVSQDNTWFDVTPAGALETEERFGRMKWEGSCKGFIDGSGSTALIMAQATPYILLVFTEVMSGMTVTMRAGIDKAGATFGDKDAKDTLDFSSKGVLGGLPSFLYV